jgi:hypothetical protein
MAELNGKRRKKIPIRVWSSERKRERERERNQAYFEAYFLSVGT